MKFSDKVRHLERKHKLTVYLLIALVGILVLASIPILRNSDKLDPSEDFIAFALNIGTEFIGAALIFLVLYFLVLDEQFGTQKATDLIPTSGFVTGVTDLLRKNKAIQTLDIFGSTSTLYYYAFRDSGIKINNLRLLVRSVEHPELMQIPSDEDAKKDFMQEQERMVNSWIELGSVDICVRFTSI